MTSHREQKKRERPEGKGDSYTHLDPSIAAAMRKDDEEIAELETKLGLSNKKQKKRLYNEYAKLEGYGEDFGEWLDGLDSMANGIAGDGNEESRSASKNEEIMMEETESSASGSDIEVGHDEEPVSSDPDEDDCDIGHCDPYTGLRVTSQESTASKRYVPPHLRQENDSLSSIKRALNNALNKLSISSIISVSAAVAELYKSNPKSDVNSCIWENVRVACVNRPHVVTGMIPVYIACLIGVHVQLGDSAQLGEYLMEVVVTDLWKELQAARQKQDSSDEEALLDNDDVSKEASNLMLVLSYLYIFNVVNCSLLYDVIRNLIGNLAEIDAESLLLILGHAGHSLRSDDPSALKEIVILVQKRSLENSKVATSASSSRLDYMVSVMMDLKNNKRRKQDSVHFETVAKLKKIIGRIKSTSNSVRGNDSSLRITLQDILDVPEKGRWWKVGASWAGRLKEDGHDPQLKTSQSSVIATADEKLLQLATKYRMNTDIRRSIFCIIMGSADCDDAFEKLVRAGMLKNRTERDTVRVLMECCGNEKNFNQFYSHLASRICDYQPQCKFTFQLAYWDIFKQFDVVKARKAANLAKLLFHLVVVHTGGALRLNVLKVVDMSSEMTESASIFLTIFFSNVLEYFEDATDTTLFFEAGLHTAAKDENAQNLEKMEESEAYRASLSVFFQQTLKASPKYKKGSKFRSNLRAALKVCDSDGFF